MSKTYFCHEDFTPGLTCVHKSNINGECLGGRFCSCPYKSSTPKLKSLVLMQPVNPPIDKSTKCDDCVHNDVCALKKNFAEVKVNNYPLVCKCEKYMPKPTVEHISFT